MSPEHFSRFLSDASGVQYCPEPERLNPCRIVVVGGSVCGRIADWPRLLVTGPSRSSSTNPSVVGTVPCAIESVTTSDGPTGEANRNASMAHPGTASTTG